MIPVYEKHVPYFVKELSKIGMKMVRNSTYMAEFENSDGWRVSYVGEPYYGPGVSVLIQNIHEGPTSQYQIRSLMQVFAEIDGIPFQKAPLLEQVDFIVQNAHRLFVTPQPYKAHYERFESIVY